MRMIQSRRRFLTNVVAGAAGLDGFSAVGLGVRCWATGVTARSSSLFPNGSIFCVDLERNQVSLGRGDAYPNHR